MTATRIEQMLLESGLETDEMTDVIDALAPLADLVHEVPVPSAELAALLGPVGGPAGGLAGGPLGGPANRASSLLGPRRGAVAGALVLALSGVGATGLSAAANTLPAPLQHQVSKFSRAYLPFDLPEPPASPDQVNPFGAQLPQGSTDLERGGGDTASRSAQPRPGDPAGVLAVDDGAAPSAQVQARPSASPSVAGLSPTASAQPSASPSSSPSSNPTPSGSPTSSTAAEGGMTSMTGKGHPDKATPTDRDPQGGKKQDKDKDKGQGKKDQGHGKDQGHDKDNGKDKGKGHDQPVDPGQGQGGTPDHGQDPGRDHGQDPGQDQGGGTGETSPAPDLPVPNIPLPDPLPGLHVIVDASPLTGN